MLCKVYTMSKCVKLFPSLCFLLPSLFAPLCLCFVSTLLLNRWHPRLIMIWGFHDKHVLLIPIQLWGKQLSNPRFGTHNQNSDNQATVSWRCPQIWGPISSQIVKAVFRKPEHVTAIWFTLNVTITCHRSHERLAACLSSSINQKQNK